MRNSKIKFRIRGKLLLLLIFFSLKAIAQRDSSGVYMSADDFIKHKLTYAINCNTEKHKIKAHDFFQQPCFVIIHRDTTTTLNKKDVFGVRLCDNRTIRFYDNREFPIINPDERILIYKILTVNSPKTYPKPNEYFFSKDAYSSPQPLTIEKLRAAFPENKNFCRLLEENFTSDDELLKYSGHFKMYLINVLFKKSLQQ